MQFKKTQLVQILGCSQAVEDKWIDPINAACAKFGIDTKLRLAAFIAQVGHESARLSAVSENLNYSAESLQKVWPSRFNADTAPSYARNPEKIANKVYGGRMGNGSEDSGDGWKYRGRGLIQCTGKANYDAFSQACGVNAVSNPDSLAEPTNAALSAAWFWGSKGLNAYADRGDFLTITKRINGGTIGQDDRERLYKKALIVLSDDEPPKTDEELDNTPVPPNPYVTQPINEQKAPGAQNSSIVEPRAAVGTGTGKYPWNLVYESRSGHVTEIDDTPGAERLNMTHRTGSYWEINSDGTFTQKSILDSYRLTREDSYEYTGANHTSQVKGTSFNQVGGSYTIKSGDYYVQAPVMYFTTGSLNVSNEINAKRISAPLFSGLGSGMAYGDMVAKEAIVAYYVKKGKAPMFGGSLGFKGIPGVEGSADGAMSNNLSTQAPDGTPWITNGINPETVTAATAGAVAGAVVAGLLAKNDADENVSNAMTSNADSLDQEEALADAAQTPVFLKHVTFDKPTLLSQSTVIDVPDPSLYVNNYHTIVDAATGVGTLHFSNGQAWIPVGEAGAKAYVDSQVGGVAGDLQAEIDARVQALIDEANARAADILSEAEARQAAIESGLLAEAAARGAAVTAEANARQTEDTSLSDRIVTLTAAVDTNAAAIEQETTARADAITAEATARETLAATVAGNTASIQSEATTRANADSALTTSVNNLSSSTDSRFATVNSSITTLTNADSALSTRIDGLVSKTDTTNADLVTEQNTRASADSALSSQITALNAKTDTTNADLITEQTARANGDSAVTSSLNIVRATASATRNQSMFQETWMDANALDLWTTYSGSGEKTIVSPSDLLSGGKALQVGNNAGDDMAWLVHNTLIPFDPNKTYRMKVQVKQTAGVGTVFIGWVGVAADGVTLVNYSGANSYAAQHYHTLGATVVPTTWTTYTGYTKGAAATGVNGSQSVGTLAVPSKVHANVKFLRPMVLVNYNSAAGIVFIGNITVENAEAELAQSSADNALSQLLDIANDNMLTISEKPDLIKEYNMFRDENAGIDAQASAFGITTEKTAYDNAYGLMAAYVTGLSPAYSDLSQNTVIVGTTFRQKFLDLYAARASLRNAITAKAKALADAAQVSANNAQTSADTANAAITQISSDNVLSKGEKSYVVLDYNVLTGEQSGLDAQATAFSITTEKTTYDTAVSALTTYLTGLSPAYNDTTTDTTIVGSTFRTKFSDVYTARTALMSAIDAKAKALANQAQTDANTANAAIAQISSDNVLSKGEKSYVILDYNVLTGEQAGLDAQATSFGITTEKTNYDTAVSALTTYLTGLTPAYTDTTTDTTIVAATFRTKFSDVYTTKQALINAINAKAKVLADQAQTDANTANAAIASIANDDMLSKGEKGATILAYNVITGEQAGLDAQATSFSITTEKTTYDTAVSALTTYLTGLSPAYNSLTTDTPIVGTTFRTKFSDVYSARTALLNAIDSKSKSLADQANTAIANITSDNVLSKGEKGEIIQDYTVITTEQSGLDAQATAFGITTEKTTYDNAVSALTTYLTGLSPAYNDTATDTTIVGSTFRQKFQDVYTSKQALANAIYAKAKSIADSKAKITIGTTAPTGPSVGDLWVDTSAGVTKPVNKTWNGSSWIEADWRIAQNSADIISEQTARANGDSAVASTVDTLRAKAAATREAIFVESWDDANAVSLWTEIVNAASEKAATTVSDAKTGGRVLQVGNNSGNDLAWLVHQNLIPFDPNKLYRMKVDVRRTAGVGLMYLGFVGVASDGTTYVAYDGTNSAGNSHYHVAAGAAPTNVWVTYTGYTKGYGATVGTQAVGTISNPGQMHPNVKYLRPLVAVNHPNAAGVTLVGRVIIEDAATELAQNDATNALAQLTNIASDNVLSMGEKPSVILDYNVLIGEQPSLDSQATAFSITTEKTTYDTAVSALTTYLNGLSPAYTTLTADTTIVGSTFRQKFQDVYTARTALLNAIDTKAKTLADAAQTSANTANTAIANITSDNVLSKGEKGDVILDYSIITAEQAGLDSQATAFSITTEKTTYDTAVSALTTYLTGLSPAYNDTTTDTTIVGSTFRTKFSDVYSARTALLNAIDTKAKTLANQAQTDANTANAAIANISSDNVLSKGEKGDVILDYSVITSEQTGLDAQATAFSITTEKTTYDNAVSALTAYLTGLSPAYNDTTTDTTIVGSTFRTKFSDVYTSRTALLNAINTKAKAIADSKGKITVSSTAPTGPATGDIWIDISAGTTKPVTKTWNGSSWIEADWRTAQNTADITTEQSARASGDSANASLITNLRVTAATQKNGSVFNESWDDANALDQWQNLSGSGELTVVSVTDTVGGKALQVGNNSGSDQAFLVHTRLIPFDATKLYRITANVKKTLGAGLTYVGFVGVASDGVTYVNTAGSNTINSQHYHAASAVSTPSTWTTYTGYTKGSTVAGDSTASSDPLAPKRVHNNVKYLRVVVVVNSSAQAGTTFIGSVNVDDGTTGELTSNVASVTTTANATATTVGQIKLQYSVKLNANGYVSGFTLINDALPGGSGASTAFIVQADQFKLVPSGSTSVSSAPFTVNTTTGKAVFQGSLSVASAATGARTEITDSVIKVYDSTGTLRVKLGDLSA